MNDIYMKYAETLYDAADARSEMSRLERLLGDLKNELVSNDNEGCYGVDMSAHASKQILERFEILASENSHIYEDVWKPKEVGASLMSPTNMNAFIIGIMAKAKKDNNCSEEYSKNSNGKEYHHKVEIKKWNTDTKKLIFTGIVENNVIKTGYFNWM